MISRHPRWRAGALGIAACAAAAFPTPAPQARAQQAHPAPVAVSWVDAPLGAALRRLPAAGVAAPFVDRRVDPNTRLTATAEGPLPDILRSALRPAGYGVSELGGVAYVGPDNAARELRTLAQRNRRRLAGARREAREALSREGALEWPRLAEPRALVQRLASEAGVALRDATMIPHDVWDEGRLPAMPRADQLTLLLYGFDLTWRVADEGAALSVAPIERPIAIRKSYPLPRSHGGALERFREEHADAEIELGRARVTLRAGAEAHAAMERLLGDDARPAAPSRSAPDLSQRRFTLSVRAQRADAILRGVAQAVGLELAYTPSGEERAREALTRRVDLTVKQAPLEELLASIGRQAGVRVSVAGDRLLVEPRGASAAD